MRDALEDRLATRLQALGDTVDDDVLAPIDLEVQVARRRRRSRAARNWSIMSVAAALVVVAASVVVVRGETGGHGAVRVVSSSSTSVVPVHDPLPQGTAMLTARAGWVISLDANGHTNATMVTVKNGDKIGDITYARATADHRAIWYLSLKNGPQACGDVVRANIDGNSSKIVAKAMAFDVSPDGTRLALYGAGNLADGQCAPVKPGGTGEIAVVDVASFETSTIPMGDVTGLRWSPDGSYLVAAHCELVCDGFRRIAVPRALGAPLLAQSIPLAAAGAGGGAIQSAQIEFGPGGLYSLQAGSSDVVYRYETPNLGGPVVVFAGGSDWDVSQIIPTTTGLDVVAAPMESGGRLGPLGLYRVGAGQLTDLRALSNPGALVPVQPLATP